MDPRDQTQTRQMDLDQVYVVEISSTEYNVGELSYFFDKIWYVFLGKVETTTEILEPREGQPKPKEPKRRTTTFAAALIDGRSIQTIRTYFKVSRQHVFVPYKNSGFTNTMFVPMNCLTQYVKDQVLLAKEEKKNEIKEIEALKGDLAASLRSKLQIMVKNNFFKEESFDVSVVIQPRKEFATFAFINFHDVREYDMGLASMVLSYQKWEMAPPGTWVEPRFSKAKPQNGKNKAQNGKGKPQNGK